MTGYSTNNFSKVQTCTSTLLNEALDSATTKNVCDRIAQALQKVKRGEMTRTGVKKKADELEDQSHTDIIKDKIEEHGDTHEIKGGWGDRMNV